MLLWFQSADSRVMAVEAMALIWALAAFLLGKLVGGKTDLLPVDVDGRSSLVTTTAVGFSGRPKSWFSQPLTLLLGVI